MCKAFVVRAVKRRYVPILSRYFGVAKVRCEMWVEHPRLGERKDDANLYRELKPCVGAWVMDEGRNITGRLMDEVGEGMWKIENEYGVEEVLPAESLNLGERSTQYFMENHVLNSPEGKTALQTIWPDEVTVAVAVAATKWTPQGVTVDPSLTTRNLFEIAYGSGALPDASNRIQAAKIRITLNKEVEEVPLYVYPEDVSAFGRSFIPNYSPTEAPSTILIITGALSFFAILGKDMWDNVITAESPHYKHYD
eukprot:TRINITY_DN38212_c0_g1_i1.p1 TRINITY_DN38212_c0_g1~~TRINITY_DN38212_c0_g1_i1.p1  ORF type:complete len:252 (+),score=12.57 TRINITY_DN38212_c0_g1_i1:67-822(+)